MTCKAPRSKYSSRKSILETCKWDLGMFFLSLIQRSLQQVDAICTERCMPGCWPRLYCKAKERSCGPHTQPPIAAGVSLVSEAGPCCCTAPRTDGELTGSEISRGLSVAFQRNWIGSSTRQKAIKKQKHHGKSCSLHWSERFTVLLSFFPRRTGLYYVFLRVVSQSENRCSWKLIFICYWMRSPVARAQRHQRQHRESAGPPLLIVAH